jgi:putative addiction module component (TIGR02574 family)
MARDAGQLLKDALDLQPAERAALADSLLESLDTAVDQDAEESWHREIEHRVAEIDTGAVRMVPWEEAERQLRAKLRKA